MNYILIGKLVNTHALKGEVRIISDFTYKTRIFIPNMKLYIGKEKESVTIETYRKHKNFDMCKFKEYNYINDVLKFKGNNVYINREDLKLSNDEYLDIDLIGLNVYYNEKNIGIIDEIENNNGYKLFIISNKYIPYNKEFIDNIDLKNKKITLKNLEEIIWK